MSVVFGQRMKAKPGFNPNTTGQTQWHLVAAGGL